MWPIGLAVLVLFFCFLCVLLFVFLFFFVVLFFVVYLVGGLYGEICLIRYFLIIKLILITFMTYYCFVLYVECTLGYFGFNCKESCSRHCKNKEPCDHISGVCRKGCQDGFIGAHCNTCKK